MGHLSRTAAALLGLMALAGPAGAATVNYDPVGDNYFVYDYGMSRPLITFTAQPGEANAVRIVHGVVDGKDVVDITDDGASLQANDPCTAVAPHTVRCPDTFRMKAALGDGDDRLEADAAAPTLTLEAGTGNDTVAGTGGEDTLSGGTGDDVISGLGGNDSIGGGGGRDALGGGEGDDSLNDNDDPAAPDRDGLDGGPGTDSVSYRLRTAAVTVDLAASVAAEDVARGVEDASTGSGADTLRGTAGANRLEGGDGEDTVDGRSGDDILAGGDGRDRAQCGDGADRLDDPGEDELVGAACERLGFAVGFGGDGTVLDAHPERVTQRALRFMVTCPVLRYEPQPGNIQYVRSSCRPTVTVAATSGKRLGAGKGSRQGDQPVRVALNRTGRKRLAARGGALVRIATAGQGMTAVSWLTRIRTAT